MQKKRTDNFNKFANKKKGSAIKESIRQEKKKVKAEARAAGEEFRKKKLDKMRGVSEEKGIKSQKSAIKSQKKEPKSTASRQHADNQQSAISNQQLPSQSSDIMPLNKFIAHAGVCGRREAAELVKEGKVVVNGDKIFEPGYKVSAKDKVVVKGKQVFLQKNAVYVLLNKPKDYITTSNDPQGRKTVLELVKSATTERIYPVGRLDRNTTGVLLLTNDGELAQKLTHPSFEVKKIYEVTLDKPVTKKDLDAILSGVTLEDGFVSADAVGYADT